MPAIPEWVTTEKCQNFIQETTKKMMESMGDFLAGREFTIETGESKSGERYLFFKVLGVEAPAPYKPEGKLIRENGWMAGTQYPPPEPGKPRIGIPFIQKVYRGGKTE